MASEETVLNDALRDVHITHTPQADSLAAESNPWQDSPSPSRSAVSSALTLHTPDVSQLDPDITEDLTSAPSVQSPKPPVNADVLLEFDPLVTAEERAAHEAWSKSASHPPPPPPRPIEVEADAPEEADSDQVPTHPTSPSSAPSTSNRPSSPIPAFPALAALARTFALPLTRSQRPRSLDTATAVPSPATISSFAQQQQSAPGTHPPSDQSRATQGLASSTSGRSSPSPSGNGKDQEPPPFDFQKFLDQMKLKGAEPVAKYLRSFLSNFAKRTFTVNDQVRLINDFLTFIAARMRESEVWRNASDAEFDNAMEGMEKLVMNRLYEFTFTPQVAKAVPPRPITADDLERDRVLSQRIALFKWIEPKHLDVPEGEGSEGFLMFAQQELLKVNHYKAPRDKLICILNCCKVIFGLIRHLHKDESADSFLPILIYVVIKANPPHLLSNVEFINRFRNPAKLQSEAGYYLSSLMGAVSFIETMDHTSLSNITQEEFERNVEDAIQSLPSTGSQTPERGFSPGPESTGTSTPTRQSAASTSHAGEESAQLLSLPTPAQTLGEDARRFLQKTGDTISKPLNAISRIFNEVLDGAEDTLAYLPGPFAPLELAVAARETLRQIFPATDPEVVEWVLEANEGDLGKSIEALLEMSSGS
ncbi:hypothetical protein BN946_scf185008.g79 [Trametes cinnabarina]|uniref:VPS9 domain-containing protein n=1 Tax=Pycnoporus cinnabarinus TaxID=5643 RepID=A0A060SFR3_PYCCI|nr:hypothetical protein BN946_scf185008.g79 [Trametes cinnabarina]